jgi:ribosomal protein S13
MARRAFKDEVARGTQGIAAVIALAKADQTLAGIKVHDLLTSLPGVGPKRAAGLIAEVGIAPSRRIRGLGEHQVAALIARLTR